ncbi:stage IV sporulation protein [Gracilibacillus boraciitolerans JCM 21714]|uniref:Stage IV sporulation protein n=1 Tax=Gracilibacillus boraciitolerans JCM 21714 TaxID=1298598 RepID=W4VDA1_9BACI|nr:stage IV sporulation protein [Gracilibacillus boraciitolerans JCM 21714]
MVDLYVSKGQPPLVQPNDVVYKGDILVSAFLNHKEEEEQEHDNKKPLAAEGEVIAEVWYKTEITVPVRNKYQVLTGEAQQKHYLHFSNFLLPIWNFRNPEYRQYQLETEEKNYYFLKWKLPISYLEQTIYKVDEITEKLTKQKARQIALEQARRELLRELPINAKITEEKSFARK